MEKKKIDNFPPIETSDVLTEEEMGQIFGGACGQGCKYGCREGCKQGKKETFCS